MPAKTFLDAETVTSRNNPAPWLGARTLAPLPWCNTITGRYRTKPMPWGHGIMGPWDHGAMGLGSWGHGLGSGCKALPMGARVHVHEGWGVAHGGGRLPLP